jgi:hypothetical protein
MKILDLPLKKEWYKLIESGIKTEEYREIKPYWIKRLCSCVKGHDVNYPSVNCTDNTCIQCIYDGCFAAYLFDAVRFRYGYTKRTMTFKIEEICYGMGKPEWGAPTDKMVFKIKLGGKIK